MSLAVGDRVKVKESPYLQAPAGAFGIIRRLIRPGGDTHEVAIDGFPANTFPFGENEIQKTEFHTIKESS